MKTKVLVVLLAAISIAYIMVECSHQASSHIFRQPEKPGTKLHFQKSTLVFYQGKTYSGKQNSQ